MGIQRRRGLLWLLVALVGGGCAMDGMYEASSGDYEYPPYSGTDADADGDIDGDADSQDQFEDVGVNPFVDASHDPFSTFAADVDTASYDILRQWLSDGDLAPAASVRLEEYVNYFDYDYPAPAIDSETPFDINLTAAPHPTSSELVLLRVGIQAASLAASERPQANLVFLIDVSGSMSSPEKLGLVQQLLSNVVNHLDRDDTISIVTYAGGTSVRLEPTSVSESSTIVSVIDSLESGGGTAGAAGIELAYQQAESAFIEGGINQVILCTDGDFNIGASGNDSLVELIEEKRRSGVTLTALGFGRGNLNDSMMEAVSNAGNGIYSVIYDEARAQEFIDRHLFPSVVHVAKDMKIQVEFNPEHVAAYRLLGYVNRAIADEDFRDDAIDAGEVGAGHRVTALYEIVLQGHAVPAPAGAPALDEGEPVEGERAIEADELVMVRVRYKDVDASEEDEAFEVAEGLEAGLMAESFASADPDFQWAVAVAMLAELVQESPFAGADAWSMIESVTEAQADVDDVRGELASLVSAIRTLLR